MGFDLLSMGWVYAAPGIAGALVLLYFLKLKRREVTISSTYLWRAALDDMRVNSPLQRLRLNLLLDISASMQAKDGVGGKTRFEQARQEALRIVDDLSRGDRAIVIAFADEARVLTSMTNSRAGLRDALEKLEPTDRPTRLAET